MQAHPVRYRKYHPNLKLAYAFGREQELIPKPIQKQIPFSNVSRWRKQENADDYFGQEVGLQIDKCLDKGLTIENTPGLASVVTVYHSIFVFFHGLFCENNLNLKKLLFNKRQQVVDLVQKGASYVSIDSMLSALHISRATYQNWLRDDLYKCIGSSFHLCLKRHPLQLSAWEVKKILSLLQDIRYKHWPIEAIANYAKQQNIVTASSSTFSKVKKWFKISRKRRRKPRNIVGVRATYPNQIWHGDISVIRTTSGLKYYLYMIIDNYSRKIINWKLETNKSGMLWSELLHNSCEINTSCHNFWTDDGSEVNNKVLTSTINEGFPIFTQF